jgi:histidine triad (HIT) family protein
VQPGAGAAGYRSISNAGDDGVQDVPHFHVHILAGRRLGPMLMRGG